MKMGRNLHCASIVKLPPAPVCRSPVITITETAMALTTNGAISGLARKARMLHMLASLRGRVASLSELITKKARADGESESECSAKAFLLAFSIRKNPPSLLTEKPRRNTSENLLAPSSWARSDSGARPEQRAADRKSVWPEGYPPSYPECPTLEGLLLPRPDAERAKWYSWSQSPRHWEGS